MDFKPLINTSVNIVATVTKISNDKRNNDMVLFEDIYVNGEFFRDHHWLKKTRRLNIVSEGDAITATATLIEYVGIEGTKLGLKSCRSIVVSR